MEGDVGKRDMEGMELNIKKSKVIIRRNAVSHGSNKERLY